MLSLIIRNLTGKTGSRGTRKVVKSFPTIVNCSRNDSPGLTELMSLKLATYTVGCKLIPTKAVNK